MKFCTAGLVLNMAWSFAGVLGTKLSLNGIQARVQTRTHTHTNSSAAACTGDIVGTATATDPACDTITDLTDCSNRYTSIGSGTFEQCGTLGRNCVSVGMCESGGIVLPAACGDLSQLTFGSAQTPFYTIFDWDKSAADTGVTFDAGQECVNQLFSDNGGVWLMEVSDADGTTFHEWSVYKSIKDRASFDAHGYITYWRSSNNRINQEFKLYTDVNDAISDGSAWGSCNYDDAAAGFPRDCCCRRSNAAFEPSKGGSGWGFFAPSRYKGNIRWPKVRLSMPSDPLP